MRYPAACFTTIVCLLSVTMSGCTPEEKDEAPKEAVKEIEAPGAKIKTTSDIGEFDPAKGKETVDSKVKISNPITAPLVAYAPMKQQVAELGVEHSVRLFHASEGRYPKSHEEFMTRIVQGNKLRLPKLSAGKRYEYDVANHKLVVVREARAEKD